MKNKPTYNIIELSKYTTPVIKEVTNKDWVLYGEKNDYFQYLIDRYLNSTTNNAIINGITKMIYGRGISAYDATRKPDNYAQLLSLFKKNDLRNFIFDYYALGMACFQVSYDKKKIVKATHFPMNTLRSGKMNEDGDVTEWYYHPNWSEYKMSDEVEVINAFGFGNKKGNEVYVLKPYVAGCDYYSPVSYVGGLPYAYLEEEIADYLINDTLNGFSGTKVVNFNNGVPDDEKRKSIVRDVERKVTGSRGVKTIVSFNSNKETETTVTDLPLNDAPSHYEYLADECRNKLIVAHRVTSPMLIGVRETGGGLGNNADEIKTANLLFDNVVINTYQDQVCDVISEIIAVNGISLNLYFKTLEPLEFRGAEKEQLSLSKDDFDDDLILDNLKDSPLDDEWELVDEREEKDNNSSIEQWATDKIEVKRNAFQKFADVVSAKPSGFSYLDKSFYKIRYKYSERYNSGKSRKFCRTMMSRNQIYRIEDIDYASTSGVNRNFGHNGQSYDLFKFKGGVNCGHFWTQMLYRRKKKTNGKYKDATQDINQHKNVKSIPKSYVAKPRGSEKAKVAPKDMPNNGHHPNYMK